MAKITPEQWNEKVRNLHQELLHNIGGIYDIWIREASNSRRTNLKRLNCWKLTKVKDLHADTEGYEDFWIEIESKKGIHKHTFGGWVVKYIKK